MRRKSPALPVCKADKVALLLLCATLGNSSSSSTSSGVCVTRWATIRAGHVLIKAFKRRTISCPFFSAANSFPQAAGPTVLLPSPEAREQLPSTPSLFTCPHSRGISAPFPPRKTPQNQRSSPSPRSQTPIHQCFLATQWEEIPQVIRKELEKTQPPTPAHSLIPCGAKLQQSLEALWNCMEGAPDVVVQNWVSPGFSFMAHQRHHHPGETSGSK